MTVHASAGGGGGVVGYLAGYYVSAGEEPGLWRDSRAADELGLVGEVEHDPFLALVNGIHPVSREVLGTRFNTDSTSGRRSVVGFDATFSAPKSLSVMWAVTGDRGWLDAHDNAVNAALSVLERYGATSRVGPAGGQAHVDTEGLVIGTFRQHTSRALDPQIHTHCFISTKTLLDDGRWRALDARWLKHHQSTLGAIYQTAVRAELTHRYGATWGPVVNGCAEIDSIPSAVLKAYSNRTVQVDQLLTERLDSWRDDHGRDPTSYERAGIERQAALDSRPRKSHGPETGLPELQARWIEQLPAGVRVEDLTAHLHPRSLRLPGLEHTPHTGPDSSDGSVAERWDQVEAMLSRSSTWDRGAVLRAVAHHLPTDDGGSANETLVKIETAADEFITARCVGLDPPNPARRRRSDGRSVEYAPIEPHYTTNRILDEEASILAWTITTRPAQPQPSTTIAPHAERHRLDVAQHAAAAAIAGDDELVLIVGPAGTGKTTMLRAAVDDLQEQGRGEVLAVAPTAQAAGVIEQDTGIPADTLAKLLFEHDRIPQGRFNLKVGATVIVDEAGMVATPDLARLAELADDNGWRVVLTGDPYQLAAVGRGGMFAHLTATSDHVHELTTVRRFTQPWEAAASLQLRLGNPTAVDTYIAHDRIHGYHTWDELAGATVTLWNEHHAAGRRIAISTSTRAEAIELSKEIQAERLLTGQLGTVSIPGRDQQQFHVGDEVATRRNDRQLTTDTGEWVRNRHRWHVTGLDQDTGMLTVTSPAVGTVALPGDYVRAHVELAYATTGYGTQGLTVDASLTVTGRTAISRTLYSGITRGHDHNHVYALLEPGEELRDRVRAILATDPVDRPAITIAQQRLPQLPTPMIEPVLPVLPATSTRSGRRELEPDQQPTPAVERSVLQGPSGWPEPNRPAARPRFKVPDWFDSLVVNTDRRYGQAVTEREERRRGFQRQDARANELEQQMPGLEKRAAPWQARIDDAQQRVDAAREQERGARYALDTASRFSHRSAHRTHAQSVKHTDATKTDLARAVAQGDPHIAPLKAAGVELQQLVEGRRYRRDVDVSSFEQHGMALETWRELASGRTLTPATIKHTLEVLYDASNSLPGSDPDRRRLRELVATGVEWGRHHQLDLEPPGLAIERDRQLQMRLPSRSGPELSL